MSHRKYGFAESIKEGYRTYHLNWKKRQFLITNRPGESRLAGVADNKLIPYVIDFLTYLAEMKF